MSADTTLLLAAHGSSHPDENNPVRLLANRLQAEGYFNDVQCGFLKEQPYLSDILPAVQTPKLSVVPMLTSHGYISDELIPAALKAVPEATQVHLCQPIGVHKDVPAIMAARARNVISHQQISTSQTAVLIAAHGNTKNPENARHTRESAARIEGLIDAPVHVAFIEEEPLISHWWERITSENLVVLPFLIGGGLHGAEDIPAMLGLDPQNPALDHLSDKTPAIGPVDVHERKIWFCRALGFEPDLIKIVYDLAK